LLFITKAFLGPTSPPHMSLPLPCTCGPHERARVVASSVRGARRRPATVGEGRGSITEARAQEWAFAMDVQEGTRERARAVEGAGTSGGGAAEHQGGADVTFGRSKLSGDVRDMLWVPPEAEDHGVGPNDDPDEGWSVDPTSGLVYPYAFPPTHAAECDDRAAARALRGLARASLRRIRAGVVRVRHDGAAHATRLPTRLDKPRKRFEDMGPILTLNLQSPKHESYKPVQFARSVALFSRRGSSPTVQAGEHRDTSHLTAVVATREPRARTPRRRSARVSVASSDKHLAHLQHERAAS